MPNGFPKVTPGKPQEPIILRNPLDFGGRAKRRHRFGLNLAAMQKPSRSIDPGQRTPALSRLVLDKISLACPPKLYTITAYPGMNRHCHILFAASVLVMLLGMSCAPRANAQGADFQGATHMVPFDEDTLHYSKSTAPGPVASRASGASPVRRRSCSARSAPTGCWCRPARRRGWGPS